MAMGSPMGLELASVSGEGCTSSQASGDGCTSSQASGDGCTSSQASGDGISEERAADLALLNEELERLLNPKNTLRTPPPVVDLSPLECHSIQMEELEALRAIYDSDMTLLNDSGTCFVVSIRFLSDDEDCDQDIIKVWFSLPPNYPCVPPVFEIEVNRSGTFTYSNADNLFDLLMVESLGRAGAPVLFDLISKAQEFTRDLTDQQRKRRREQEEAERRLRDGDEKKSESEELEKQVSINSGDSLDEHSLYYSREHYRPTNFIGSLSEIIKIMPEGVEISRIENILRQDLASRFRRCCKNASELLWKNERKSPQEYCLKPQVAFHGTSMCSLPSIVQHGLVVPGDSNRVAVRHGAYHGVGIYTSPDASTSLSYSDSNRLIVCAVLLGRMYKISDYSKAPSNPPSIYSIVSDYEWVVFNAVQVLPCYVVQTMQSRSSHSHARTSGAMPVMRASPMSGSSGGSEQIKDPYDYEELTLPALKEREKIKKLVARAQKYLPYGFGPGRMVIEDAAEYDDDEEDYGDYQELRHTATGEPVYAHVEEEHSSLQHYRTLDPDLKHL